MTNELFCSCGASLGAYRHGPGTQKSVCAKCKRARKKVWRQVYQKLPEVMKRKYAAVSEIARRPETKEKRRQWLRNYRKNPEVVRRRQLSSKAYRENALVKKRERERQAKRANCPMHKLKHAEKEARRRAQKKSTSMEKLEFIRIFERDQWHCQICGEQINSSLTWPHPLSPSIDHVLPLSRGGSHTYDNVQASHLKCNISYGARNKDGAPIGECV